VALRQQEEAEEEAGEEALQAEAVAAQWVPLVAPG
jgi:hypothetical protein